MAVRFPCAACTQPIEVDDEWASMQVQCPYCQKTVTAPNESTLADPESIPTATTVAPLALNDPRLEQSQAQSESPNQLAIVAAVFVALALLALVGFTVTISSHAAEFKGIMDRVSDLTNDGTGLFGAIQDAGSESYDTNGGLPPDWMLAVGLFEIGGFLTWITGLVCSIIACFRLKRRRLAIGSLVVACLMPFLFCIMPSVLI